MTRRFVRSALAAVAGFILAWVLVLIFQYAGANIFPSGYDRPEYEVPTEEILVPIGATISLVIGWFVGTFAGAWLSMRISAGSGAGWVVAGAVMGAAIYRASSPLDDWWIFVLAVIVPAISALLAQRATALAGPSAA